MLTLLTVVHVIVCLFLIVIVLLQHGKGADIGATFGGSSQTLFGSEGPLPLLNKITTLAAIIFMCTSVGLAYYATHAGTESVMKELAQPAAQSETAQPVTKEEAPESPAVNAANAVNASATATEVKPDAVATPETKVPLETPVKPDAKR
ncbi:MAG: preprotein translocase subunit SecG [Desulfobulbaceae bacterium]|jgi:preprotein translocase subunit SecG|nr:preprotein translocase subunit SecG [Desulfobulbaceae bacterium]